MRTCKVCGCTEDHACDVLGIPCCMVQEDLCSACATLVKLLESEDAGKPWMITVIGEYFAREMLEQTE